MSAHNNFREITGSLFEEAERQLNICNSCRYCEGYCAVFTSLKSRTPLTKSDISHAANLCHDCRNCFYACMYSPPHSFAVNPPQIFAEIRRVTYEGESGNFLQRFPAVLRGWRGAVFGVAVSAVVLIGTALSNGGVRSLLGRHHTPVSPYSVIPYGAILVFAVIPFAWSALMMLRSARRYWIDIQGNVKSRISCASLYQAVLYAGNLRYLKGGGVGCAYPDEEMSPTRRTSRSDCLWLWRPVVLNHVGGYPSGFVRHKPTVSCSVSSCRTWNRRRSQHGARLYGADHPQGSG